MDASLVCAAEVVCVLDVVALSLFLHKTAVPPSFQCFSCVIWPYYNHLFAEKLLQDVRWIRLFKHDCQGEKHRKHIIHSSK